MPVSALGWLNTIPAATLAATSQEPTLGVANLKTDQGAASTAWQTLSGAYGATLTITPPARTTFRAAGIFRSNLSSTASFIAKAYIQPASPAMDLNFLTATSLDPQVTFTRASTATYFNAAGILSTAAINAARFDYDPATLQPRGLLMEDSRTNLMLWSEAFDNSVWVKTASTITPDSAVAPNGNTTADKWVEDTSEAAKRLQQQVTVTSAATVTISVVAAAAGRTQFILFEAFSAKGSKFDLSNGTILTADAASGLSAPTSSAIVALGGGKYRCSITATVPGTSASLSAFLSNGTTPLYTGDGASGIYIWGAQLEQAAYSTSYIPTTTATVTRSADVNFATPSGGMSATAGTVVADYFFTYPAAAGLNSLLAEPSNAGDSNNDIRVYVGAGGLGTTAEVITGGANKGTIGGAAALAGTAHSTASAWTTSNITVLTDGGTVSTSATLTGSLPTLTRIAMGNWSPGGQALNGYVRRFRYWSRALSTAEMQQATAPVASSTVTVANGQAVAVFAADTAADWLELTLTDLANPDGHLNVPLAFAGPLWFPATALSWSSAMGRDAIVDSVTTRGGQVYTNLRATNRRWEMAFDGIRTSELFTQLDPLDRYARTGGNALIIPDSTSANLQYEATYGQITPTADIAYPYSTPARRSWRARISERL